MTAGKGEWGREFGALCEGNAACSHYYQSTGYLPGNSF